MQSFMLIVILAPLLVVGVLLARMMLVRQQAIKGLGPAEMLPGAAQIQGKVVWRARKAPTLNMPLSYSYEIKAVQKEGLLTARFEGRTSKDKPYGSGEVFLELKNGRLEGRCLQRQGGTSYSPTPVRGKLSAQRVQLQMNMRPQEAEPELEISFGNALSWQAPSRAVRHVYLQATGSLQPQEMGHDLLIQGELTDQREWGELEVNLRFPNSPHPELAQAALLLICSEILRANQ